jgi:6-phosphogluconate dehydrogenase
MLGIICEAWALLRHSLGYSNAEIADIFASWNKEGELQTTYVRPRDNVTERD